MTLVVPGFSDDEEDLKRMADFLASVDPLMPWHMTAFHPDYKMMDHRRTEVDDMMKIVEYGRSAGLKYLYPGNLPGQVGDWENTRCHHCTATVIKRDWFPGHRKQIDRTGHMSRLRWRAAGHLGPTLRPPGRPNQAAHLTYRRREIRRD